MGFSSERRVGHFLGDKEKNADGDGGSVRRYRVDMDVDGGESEEKGNEGSEEANDEKSGVGGWSVCFGRKG